MKAVELPLNATHMCGLANELSNLKRTGLSGH